METFKYRFRRLFCLTILATLIVGTKVIKAQEELNPNQEINPDQNPNYKKSLEKYMAKKDELTKNEGTTVQATYKAIDDMQIKQENKDLRKSNRQDRRLARIGNRGRGYNRSPYYNNNSMYYNNSMNGYNNYGGYNNYNPYQNYTPYNNYYSPSYGLNAIGNLGLFGLGTYLWLHH